jgi:hypothetical protein
LELTFNVPADFGWKLWIELGQGLDLWLEGAATEEADRANEALGDEAGSMEHEAGDSMEVFKERRELDKVDGAVVIALDKFGYVFVGEAGGGLMGFQSHLCQFGLAQIGVVLDLAKAGEKAEEAGSVSVL